MSNTVKMAATCISLVVVAIICLSFFSTVYAAEKVESNLIPSISSVSPLKAFAGDSLEIAGDNLDLIGVKFYWGKYDLKRWNPVQRAFWLSFQKMFRPDMLLLYIRKRSAGSASWWG